eukprot:15450682-Alexandrium_andersonii.AAC.1
MAPYPPLRGGGRCILACSAGAPETPPPAPSRKNCARVSAFTCEPAPQRLLARHHWHYARTATRVLHNA